MEPKARWRIRHRPPQGEDHTTQTCIGMGVGVLGREPGGGAARGMTDTPAQNLRPGTDKGKLLGTREDFAEPAVESAAAYWAGVDHSHHANAIDKDRCRDRGEPVPLPHGAFLVQ
jgi:hypothetical protein